MESKYYLCKILKDFDEEIGIYEEIYDYTGYKFITVTSTFQEAKNFVELAFGWHCEFEVYDKPLTEEQVKVSKLDKYFPTENGENYNVEKYYKI